MSSLEKVTARLKEKGEKALVVYLTALYPDEATFVELLHAASGAGCDVIEVGVPFSDPIADGPVIQEASESVLSSGASLSKIIDVLKRATASLEAPLVIMSYANPVLRFGLGRFSESICAAGVSGVILPDVPFEESTPFRRAIADGEASYIDLIAPTSGRERIERISEAARGFIYLISVTGVTGTRGILTKGLDSIAGAVRALTTAPLYVGFGISGPEQAKEAARFSDGVIMGSAIIERIMRSPSNRKAVESACTLIREVKEAMNG